MQRKHSYCLCCHSDKILQNCCCMQNFHRSSHKINNCVRTITVWQRAITVIMCTKRVTMKAILLLFDSSDSSEWKNYIKESLEKCSLKIEVTDKDAHTEITDFIMACSSHTQITIIVSHQMLEIMMSKYVQLAPGLQNHPCVSVIGLYQDTKYIANRLHPVYNNAQVWKYFSIHDRDEQKVRLMISQIMDILEEAEKVFSNPPVPASIPKTVEVRSYVKTICPTSVRQCGEKVVIVLQKSFPAEKLVQVRLGDTIIDTEKLNDMCYVFKAPAYKAGTHHLYVLLDGKKISRILIHYLTMCNFAYAYPEYLCQLIGLDEDDKAGLDQHLTNIFKSSAPQDHSLEILLSPKNISTLSTVGSQSDDELPTLLHFACKHGLNDLAASIVDTKGSFEALKIYNVEGKTPLDLAEEAGNEELVNYIKGVTEMQDYITSVEEIYELMSGKQLHYVNTSVPDAMRSQYEDGGIADEAYVTAKIPSNSASLSEYDYSRKHLDSVSEVQKEDDVTHNVGATYRRSASMPEDRVPPRPAHRPLIKDKQSHHNTIPCLPDGGTLPRNDLMGGRDNLPAVSMGSNTLNDLRQYQEAFKRGEFSLDDMERLYHFWQDRNRDTISASLKERKKHLEDLKATYQPVIQSTRKGLFSRMIKKKVTPQIHVIEHNVPTTIGNKHESCCLMAGTDTINRDSTTSNTSSSSSGSRDSAHGTVPETLSVDSDEDLPPVVPPRDNFENRNAENRKSYGQQFLLSLQNQTPPRLPNALMQHDVTHAGTCEQAPPRPKVLPRH